jgi:dipeptide/tripeptide permease
MRAIISGLTSMLAGSIGWWLGSKMGFAAAVLLSAILGPVGFYYGRKWFDDNLG